MIDKMDRLYESLSPSDRRMLETLELAQAEFDRKAKLWKRDVSSEREYLTARKDLAQAKIDLRAARQKLIAMGFTSPYLETLPDEDEELFTRYEIVAPFDSSVIKKHIALGEVLKDDAEVYIVADLRTVWIHLQIYKKEMLKKWELLPEMFISSSEQKIGRDEILDFIEKINNSAEF